MKSYMQQELARADRRKASHTPGPWEVPGMDGDEYVICRRDHYGKRRTVAHVYTASDARLLAAAPEQDAALRRLYGAVMAWRRTGKPDLAELSEACDDANAAIAKATFK